MQKQLDWLAELANRHQAGKSYAWARAQELEADKSGLFAGIKDALTLKMGGTIPLSVIRR